MNVSGLSSALSAIQRQSQTLDRAAARLARAGLNDPVDAPADPSAGEATSADGDMASATVDSLVARTLFAAAARLAQTTNENISDALRIGGYVTGQT